MTGVQLLSDRNSVVGMPNSYYSFGEMRYVWHNYFGEGEDGYLTVSAGSTEELPSNEDGDMVVRRLTGLDLGSDSILTVQYRCRGLLLYVDGDINGSTDAAHPSIVTMQAKGCHADPADSTATSNTPVAPSDGHPVSEVGIQIPLCINGSTEPLTEAHLEGCGSVAYELMSKYSDSYLGKGEMLVIHRVGGAGGEPTPERQKGNPGEDGAPGQSGGGSAGSCSYSDGSYNTYGQVGTCFSGGSGGGSEADSDHTNPAEPYGGRGGDGYNNGDSAGGIGNPNSDTGAVGENEGTGGLLIVICSGNITGNIIFRTNGVSYVGTAAQMGPGSSGAGVLALAYGGTKDSGVTLEAIGGEDIGSRDIAQGGKAGDGYIYDIPELTV